MLTRVGSDFLRFAFLPARTLIQHRRLIFRLTVRDIAARYRGSMLGVAWSLLSPLLLLAVFAFFFGLIFRSRWSPTETGVGSFAVFAFSGLVLHGFISDVLGRAHTVVRSHPSFVKRVVFPLEALVWVPVFSAAFHLLAYLAVLVVFVVVVKGGVPITGPLVALWLLPVMLLGGGLCFLFAALGVFFRDLGQIVPFLATTLLYVSPVFYAMDAVPKPLRPVLNANPLAWLIEGIRSALITGSAFDRSAFLVVTIAAWLFIAMTCWLFRRLSPAFADLV
ncbi:ABC transporter permease [Niveibacterium microcysteis]|uniref:Transport permease protein n=1 Tax=Niveibacterium microcysteis TaxID=2811415 RepID=A0ABX7M3W8_9RHOO|nr:ABC transporter permease [Niveibacterium microcysteis]QSI75601.1 ABC transporter permease [Niveibacterium microcysteis]